MKVVLHLDEAAVWKAARYKVRYLRAKRELGHVKRARELDQVRIGELEALVSGLRNENEWLRELRDNPDRQHY